MNICQAIILKGPNKGKRCTYKAKAIYGNKYCGQHKNSYDGQSKVIKALNVQKPKVISKDSLRIRKYVEDDLGIDLDVMLKLMLIKKEIEKKYLCRQKFEKFLWFDILNYAIKMTNNFQIGDILQMKYYKTCSFYIIDVDESTKVYTLLKLKDYDRPAFDYYKIVYIPFKYFKEWNNGANYGMTYEVKVIGHFTNI